MDTLLQDLRYAVRTLAKSPGFATIAILTLGPGIAASSAIFIVRPGGPRVVVLSDGLWRRRFGADPGVVGRSLTLSGDPFTVIGVMAPGFGYPAGAEFWTSTALDGEFTERAARHFGTTIVQVTHSEANAGYGQRIVQLKDGWIVN